MFYKKKEKNNNFLKDRKENSFWPTYINIKQKILLAKINVFFFFFKKLG